MFFRRVLATIATITLTAALANAGDMHKAGDVMIEGAFSRATLPNQPVAGAFMRLKNTGDEADALIGGSTEIAGRVEVHEMAMSGDVMKMRELADGLEVPAGETVELKPGGYHIMLFDLKEPLVEGEVFEITLEFAKGGSVIVPFMIAKKGAKMAHSH